MSREWFRHDSTASSDHALAELCDEFGPLAEVVWFRLLELHCEDDDGILIRREDLRSKLRLRDGWAIDIDGFLKRARALRLLSVAKPYRSRTNLIQITARSWTRKNPDYESREAARERKRKSRGNSGGEESQGSHSDIGVTSHPTVQDGTDETRRDEEERPTSPPDGDQSEIVSAEHFEAHRLCSLLADLIEANGSNRPNVTRPWVDAAERLIRLDGRSAAQVEAAIRWSQADEFWRGNILSMPTLRRQYDKLRLAASRSNGKGDDAMQVLKRYAEREGVIES